MTFRLKIQSATHISSSTVKSTGANMIQEAPLKKGATVDLDYGGSLQDWGLERPASALFQIAFEHPIWLPHSKQTQTKQRFIASPRQNYYNKSKVKKVS